MRNETTPSELSATECVARHERDAFRGLCLVTLATCVPVLLVALGVLLLG